MLARAQQILQEVRLILAENTRHTAKLLGRYGITTPTRAYHRHPTGHKRPRF